MARRGRAVLALGALAAHCAALEPPSRRTLISFDANTLAESVSNVEDAVVDTANNIISAVLNGAEEEATRSPATSISITIGGEQSRGSQEDETTVPTTGVSVSGDGEETTVTPTPTHRSGVSHAVSMTKRPTTYKEDEIGAESTADSGAETAPTPTTQAPTTISVTTRAPVALTDTPATISVSTAPVVAVSTQAPTTVYIVTEAPAATPIITETPAAAPVSTEAPVSIPVLTEAPAAITTTTGPPAAPATTETQAPVATDAPAPPTLSSSATGSAPQGSAVDDGTNAATAAGSISTDAAVVVPDDATAAPLATTGTPAAATGSSDASPNTPATGMTDTPDWSGSFSSSGNNETVTAYPEGENDANGDVISPGEVHASSSAEVSLDGSSDQHDTEDTESSASHGGNKKNERKKKEMMRSSSSGDSSAGSSPMNSRSNTTSSSHSDSGSSSDRSGGMGALLNPGGVSDVNTSSATYYSLGTGSIVAIVGVIAGIVGVLMLFATISRKKYTDDDDESPLPYGYNMDIRSVARLSPTFMQDDSFMESGYNGTALMVEMPAPHHHYDGASSSSGESVDEVPSLRGNMMAVNPMADVSLRSQVPSVRSFSGDADTENVRVSALYSGGSSMTSGSAISGSWSSVLASDTERQPSRNTRDTSLSAWSIANLSSLGSTASGASGASGLHRMTRSSSALSADIRQTGGSDRSHGSTVLSASRLMNQPNTNRAAATAAAVESNRSNKSTEV